MLLKPVQQPNSALTISKFSPPTRRYAVEKQRFKQSTVQASVAAQQQYGNEERLDSSTHSIMGSCYSHI